MRAMAAILGVASACYSPTALSGAPCEPDSRNCPFDQTCNPTPSGWLCQSPNMVGADGGVDGPVDDASVVDAVDAPPAPDGPPPDAQQCFGTGLVQNVCFAQPPTGALAIVGTMTINTAMVSPQHCTQIVAQSGGPSLCVVAKQSIQIGAAGKLTATGPNVLVLIASQLLQVAGTIDVSSQRAGSTGVAAQASCGSGVAGSATVAVTDGAGGGAGGSFGGAGRSGGTGSPAIAAGTSNATMSPSVAIGGCPGGAGGQGYLGMGSGSAGAGGGAVYLIAGTTIAITGSVTASGAGGGGGAGTLGGGGGGGGAGGMIGLDAPTIMITGAVYANGGGAGGGTGNTSGVPGQAGSDSAAASTAAPGGTGGNGGGGNGGRGFAGSMMPLPGGNGTANFCGGGGGGGGAGVIRVFQVAPGSLGGTISPPAT